MTRFRVAVEWGTGVAVEAEASGEGQSTTTADGLTVIVFGTLLARDALEGEHPSGASLTDAELVAAAFPARGLDWLDRVAGDFVVVVVDARAGTVSMARNVAGTRPLFYGRTARGVRVASDFAGSGKPGGRLEELADLHSVGRFLSGNPPLPGRTIRSDISSVVPGQLVTVDRSGERVHGYWAPPPARMEVAFPAAAQALREVVGVAVREAALSAAGPVGVHVTGGLDSAVVAKFAVEALREVGRPDPVAYAWQPAPDDREAASVDQRLIDEVCSTLGIRCRWRAPEDNLLRECLAFDPLAMPFTSTMRRELGVMRTARSDGVTTILSGWGGDEFASYNGRHLRPGGPRATLGRVKTAVARRRRRHRRAGFPSELVRDAGHRPEEPEAPTARAMQLALLRDGFLGERADSWAAIGDAFGVEYSFPLLDRRVVDYVLGLPDGCFPRGRGLMRAALCDVVPESVRHNIDKSDAAVGDRSERELDAIASMACAGAGERLVDTERRRFVDVERLMAALCDPARPQPGKVTNALQLVWRR